MTDRTLHRPIGVAIPAKGSNIRVVATGLLVPSAPVPFGGALIYVPSEWVKPAEGGVERLMNVYVSMGVTPPVSKPPLIEASVAKPKARQAPKTKSSREAEV